MLQYFAPPILGAFIGYMTNYVAIRMLFRPLRPWRVLGFKLPLTPGVIPSKRKQLARNIGEMVGEHLLTTKDVGRALSSGEFQGELGRLVDGKLEDLLSRDLGSINELIPEDFRSIYRANIRVLRLRMRSRLHAYLDSDEFATKIDRMLTESSSDLMARELGDVFPVEKQEEFFTLVEDILARLLASPMVKEMIADIIRRQITGFMDERKSMADLVSPDLLNIILDRLEDEASPLLARLAELLKKPSVQKKMSEAIAEAAGHFTSSLGPFGSMLGSVLSPESIREKIASFMSEKGDKIGSWLDSEDIRKETARIIREKTEEFAHKPLSEYLNKVSREKIDSIIEEISGYIAERLARPGVAAGMSDCLRQALHSQEDKKLEAIAIEIFGPQEASRYRHKTVQAITSLVRSEKAKGLGDRLMIEILEKQILNKPIGPLSNIIPEKIKLSVHNYIMKWSSTILVREVPHLVDSLNIRDIVARKVDSLDLLRLEGLLMSIMQEQFKYINLFGGLLGLIIGLLNLLFLI